LSSTWLRHGSARPAPLDLSRAPEEIAHWRAQAVQRCGQTCGVADAQVPGDVVHIAAHSHAGLVDLHAVTLPWLSCTVTLDCTRAPAASRHRCGSPAPEAADTDGVRVFVTLERFDPYVFRLGFSAWSALATVRRTLQRPLLRSF